MDSALLKVAPANMHYPCIFTVVFQQRLTKCEERRIRETIILQDDLFRFSFKELNNGGAHGVLAAQVVLPEEREQLTGPVHAGGN